MKTTSRTKKKNALAGTIDHDLVKAMAHPLRYELLMKLNGRTASPMELSREVAASVGTVSYHLRLLEQMGFAELVDQKQRRGAVEHFYRATQRAWFSNQGWTRLPGPVRRSIAGATLSSISESIQRAEGNKAFENPDLHLSSTDLELDEQGYAEVCEVLDSALQEVMDIQAASAKRGGSSRSTQLVLMHFDRG